MVFTLRRINMYKVEFDLLAFLDDGRVGNVNQNLNTKICYSNSNSLGDIELKLKRLYYEKKQTPIIKKIEIAEGFILE